MAPATKLSVVLPVRDNQDDVIDRVEKVVGALRRLSTDVAEVVVVDDGSQDATPHVLMDYASENPQVRVVRHSRPRGLEAAGQTGLERARGEVVFIQESNTDVRVEDLQRLLRMSRDYSIVAARAESAPRPLAPSLLRRLRAFGTDADMRVNASTIELQKTSMQMIRRPNLQRLMGVNGHRYQLQGQTLLSTQVERA